MDKRTCLNDYVVIDFETTGLDHKTDRVIEIAAVRIENGKEAERFVTLIHYPEMTALPEKVTELTGITLEDLQLAGSDEVTAFRMLYRFVGNRVIVAHNALYEAGFLHEAYWHLSAGKFGLTNPLLCTLTLARHVWDWPHKLVNCLERIEGQLLPAHRALPDVLMTTQLLEYLRTRFPCEDHVNQIAYYRKYGPPAFVPDYIYCFPL